MQQKIDKYITPNLQLIISILFLLVIFKRQNTISLNDSAQNYINIIFTRLFVFATVFLILKKDLLNSKNAKNIVCALFMFSILKVYLMYLIPRNWQSMSHWIIYLNTKINIVIIEYVLITIGALLVGKLCFENNFNFKIKEHSNKNFTLCSLFLLSLILLKRIDFAILCLFAFCISEFISYNKFSKSNQNSKNQKKKLLIGASIILVALILVTYFAKPTIVGEQEFMQLHYKFQKVTYFSYILQNAKLPVILSFFIIFLIYSTLYYFTLKINHLEKQKYALFCLSILFLESILAYFTNLNIIYLNNISMPFFSLDGSPLFANLIVASVFIKQFSKTTLFRSPSQIL